MMAEVAQTAVLLIAHGSRRAEANADLERVAEALRARSAYSIIEISYLEVTEPTIAAGGMRCVERGAARVLLLPYFLSAGSHVTDDLERHRAELAAKHAPVEFRLCPPLGLHPALIDALLDRLAEG
ncbi:MAG: CbiX/SirB N-terminal domain-containing protein [Planctomycetales bacterium]